MARIVCKTPSTGKPLNLTLVNLSTNFTTLADAPDFSMPDTSEIFPVRDPLDDTRAIRPGEVFFLTPLFATNKTGTTRWIEVRLVLEDGTVVLSPGRVSVPANETVSVPIQGRSLTKRLEASSNGDRLQARAEAANVFDIWAAAEERLSAEHIGVVV